MEHMNVFHRIFHEDLHPLTTQKSKEHYTSYLNTKNANEFISEDLKIEDLVDHELKYYYFESLLNGTLKEIKRDLHQKLFSFAEENGNIELLVKNYQMFILNYKRIIAQDYLSRKDGYQIFQISEEKSNTDIFKKIYKTLDAILVYLEQTFINYIDLSLEVPYQQRLWFVHQHKEKIVILKDKIGKLDIPKIVKDELCHLLSDIGDNTLLDLTYESREYYTTFLKVVSHLLKSNRQPCKEEVYAVLISLDYNTFKIFFFLTKDIKEKAKTSIDNEGKLNVYREYLKTIKTTAITTAYRLNPELPSLKVNLMNWVTEEISFYDQLIAFENAKSLEGIQTRKLLKVSVPEVSLIAKLLYESKMVDGPRKDLFSFLSKTFRTEKSAQISSESLSNNYYSISEGSKRSVKKMLNGMILQLDQMKGEL